MGERLLPARETAREGATRTHRSPTSSSYLPIDYRHERERLLTADYNAEIVDHVAHRAEVRDLAVFIARPRDARSSRRAPSLAADR